MRQFSRKRGTLDQPDRFVEKSKQPCTPPRFVDAHGPSRLARQDHGMVTMRLDDLEYTLEGLCSPRASIIVLRRCATDLVTHIADRKQRTMLFRASGVLSHILSTAAKVTSTDAHVSLAIATVLHVIAHEEAGGGAEARSLVACLLRRLPHGHAGQAGSSGPSAPPSVSTAGTAVAAEKLWALVREACAGQAERLAPPPGSEWTEAAVMATARRACMFGIEAAAAASALCRQEMRSQGGVSGLLAALNAIASQPDELTENWAEAEGCLQARRWV